MQIDENKADNISIKNSYIQTIYYKTQGNDDSSQFKRGVLSNFHASSRINKKNINLSNETVYQALKMILKEIYNYESFKEGQEEIIEKVLKNQTCLGLLPTGGGKSVVAHAGAPVGDAHNEARVES